jgi:hypothetical protein
MVYHKSEMAGPFSRGDTMINKTFTFYIIESMYSEDLHNELRHKMNTSDDRMSPRGREDRMSYDERAHQSSPRRQSGGSPRSPVANRRSTNISQYSTADEVRDWIEMKGFSRRFGIILFISISQRKEKFFFFKKNEHYNTFFIINLFFCSHFKCFKFSAYCLCLGIIVV